jgi:hypothetical protein
VGRAAAVLDRQRAPIFGALLVVLVGYYALVTLLPDLPRDWDVAWLGVVLIPAMFALVGLALPLRRFPLLLPMGLGLALLAGVYEAADFETAAWFFKLGAMAFLGFWFLSLFEALWWAVLVALIVPLVDAYSVWRGPTRHIVEEREEVFINLSIGFPVWGHEGTANLGLPDLLFFSVFLAAAARWRLRVFWTWLAMAVSFGATLALAVWADIDGLPALPLLCLAFLAPNVDLLWRELRGRGS